jgi:hypothetical protein
LSLTILYVIGKGRHRMNFGSSILSLFMNPRRGRLATRLSNYRVPRR